MTLVASNNFDNTDCDVLTIEEWNCLIVLLKKLRGCKLEISTPIKIMSDE